MMRLKLKKAVPALLLPVALATAAGCAASGGGTADSNVKQAAQPAKEDKPVEINFSLSGTGMPEKDKDDIANTLNKKLGITLKVNAISADYDNQLNVKVAGGNVPDLFTVSQAQLKDFAEKGVLLDLTSLWDTKLKATKDFYISTVGEGIIKKGTVKGKSYAVPRTGDEPSHTFWIRQDWLDALGLQAPTTLDDLFKVAVAFTENDPDGNGKKDTFGITGTELAAFTPLFGAYGVGSPDSFYEKGGKYVNAYYDPAMPDALTAIKKFVDAGVVMPQVMTNKSLNYRDQAFQGKAGIMYAPWYDISKDEFVAQYKAVNPQAKWVQLAAPKGPGGAYFDVFDKEKPSRYYAMSKSLEKDPAKLQKVLDLISYVSGKEGLELVMFGLEGKHYNKKDGNVVPTELMAKEGNYFNNYQMAGRPNNSYNLAKFPNNTKDREFAINAPRLTSFDSSVVPPAGFSIADAKRYAQEELVKFIYGKRPIGEYADFLKTLSGTYKYDLYIDEAQKIVKELGYIK
ncbi:extracellular solute-binding protein [Paenibacillus thalictri]|uniref:Extracellular solute-binding protein n=1 Tax=Paenibacillus thalictri TaxID=2527873 RepID=A0A4Q9DRQ4_9BACL|nr:extracellular solute-binding protein [Paenibacillus thalictri]TBL76369.1 extracellular solute-binding protein [Paenibacillus thalictri]